MHIFFCLILAIISVIHADVSHLANNRQADGYHYEQPSYPFPSENEIIPQQSLSGRNDFNPPAFLAQLKPSPQPVTEKPVPEYIPPVQTNLQEDGYHYQQPSVPFPSPNHIIPQQTLTGRNDFNPPAFLLQPKPSPQQPAPEPVPEYIPPTPEYVPPTPEYIPPTPEYIPPPPSNLQEDGYHYQQPSVPFPSPNQIIPQQTLTGRNDFNPPAFLLQPKPSPQQPAPELVPEYIPPTPEYVPPTPEYIPPTPEYIPPAPANLQEDGYHYQQPSIPFPSANEIIPSQQPLSGRNDFNPPAFLAQQKPEEPIPQEPVPEQPVVQIPEYVAPEPVNLQEDGYHYEQPSIPFESQQSLTGRNDFNPPAFLLAKPEEPETPAPAPEEPAPEEPAPEEPAPEEPAPEELAPVEPAPEEPAPVEPAPEEPAPEQPAPEEPAPEQPAQYEQIPEEPIQPAPTPVETNLQDDGYHYAQPSIPFVQPEPVREYLPVAEPERVQPQPEISSYFGTAQPEPEPSYSLGPNGYNYRVPSRPFRF